MLFRLLQLSLQPAQSGGGPEQAVGAALPDGVGEEDAVHRRRERTPPDPLGRTEPPVQQVRHHALRVLFAVHHQGPGVLSLHVPLEHLPHGPVDRPLGQRVRGLELGDVALDAARDELHDADVERLELHAHAVRERGEGCLCAGVRRRGRLQGVRRLRRVVHDDALGVDEVRQEDLGQFELGEDVELEHAAELFGRGVRERHDDVAAGVVEEDVELRDAGTEGADRLCRQQVQLARVDPQRGQPGESRQRARSGDDMEASSMEFLGQLFTDGILRAPRYQDRLSGVRHVVSRAGLQSKYTGYSPQPGDTRDSGKGTKTESYLPGG